MFSVVCFGFVFIRGIMLHLLVAQHYTAIFPKSPVVFKLLIEQGCKVPGGCLHCYLAMLIESLEKYLPNGFYMFILLELHLLMQLTLFADS